jgi:hypothetical protein
LHHPANIFCHLVIPKPDRPVAMHRQFRCPRRVFLRSVRMLTAIDFNRQLACRTREIDNETSDRMLPAELPFRAHVAQSDPKPTLHVGGVPP